jgi:hypothetical protein
MRVEAVDLVDDVHGREGGVVSGGEQLLCRRELAPFRDPEGECVEHDDLGLVIADGSTCDYLLPVYDVVYEAD